MNHFCPTHGDGIHVTVCVMPCAARQTDTPKYGFTTNFFTHNHHLSELVLPTLDLKLQNFTKETSVKFISVATFNSRIKALASQNHNQTISL